MEKDYSKLRLVSNSVKCNACNDIIWSGHVHAFRSCKCGALSVDGGLEYRRRVGNGIANMIDLSVSASVTFTEELKDTIHDSRESGRNDLGVAYAVLRQLGELRRNGIDLNDLIEVYTK